MTRIRVSKLEYVCAYIGLHVQPSCMCTHTSSMHAHIESMRTHTRTNSNSENENIVDKSFISSNLACLKKEKLRKPRLDKHINKYTKQKNKRKIELKKETGGKRS